MVIRHRTEPASKADPLTQSVADRQLAARILDGVDGAFDELVARHFAHVARIAGRFFRRQEAAEEIHQEVFLKAFTSLRSYRGDVPLEHWLAKIAVNACYDALRRAKRRPESPIDGEVNDLAATDPSGFWRREHARIAADEMLALLAPAERLVLTLMILEDRTAAEVADLTGWTVVNVKVRAFRARGKLKAMLAKGPRDPDGRRR